MPPITTNPTQRCINNNGHTRLPQSVTPRHSCIASSQVHHDGHLQRCRPPLPRAGRATDWSGSSRPAPGPERLQTRGAYRPGITARRLPITGGAAQRPPYHSRQGRPREAPAAARLTPAEVVAGPVGPRRQVHAPLLVHEADDAAVPGARDARLPEARSASGGAAGAPPGRAGGRSDRARGSRRVGAMFAHIRRSTYS